MTLDELERGQTARVVGMDGDGPLMQRLMAMGLLEGSVVRLIRKALGGDPIEVEVMDYALSLRLSEARRVRVTLDHE